MKPTVIQLQIGELVLEGMDPTGSEYIDGCIERELNRLMLLDYPRGLGGEIAELNLSDLEVNIEPGADPDGIGMAIARSIYNQIRATQPVVPQQATGPENQSRRENRSQVDLGSGKTSDFR